MGEGALRLVARLLGSAVTGLDLRPGQPFPPSPEPSSPGFEAALALASASSATDSRVMPTKNGFIQGYKRTRRRR
ncbi:hypothetical protein BSZ22_01920 [Bradyrhizobium canariense]|uniref:Uncharacterized protein n=1 Tax=Bradyrhizobium canariense TaxID=255045 RepID=A0A1X3HFJ2_9BRAD|nr:hypothetical protein BSZ22_01920 [Bradyrhizobium canariense]OSI82574.1 hypothetical protein BSZ23_00850 [Bradyrhizobium canariense]OSI97874.1 hypothetical protein BSZ25_00585 [Bradyrhizobium canariense]OSJ00258.1 hypothetical protein BSZ24_00145 [Bradyrhizobium canariense]OSJ17406.1 hypothetical protein BSZ16_00645 [Bradyrhizobium canariense]